jgi:hypothetical protein
MKLILKFENGCSAPVAWCEVCNTQITDAFLAMVYWRTEDYRRGFSTPLLVHKRCMSASQSLEERYDYSMELTSYLAFLLKNVGLGSSARLEQATRNAELVGMLR